MNPITKKLAIHGGKPAKATPYGTGNRFGQAEEEAAVAAIRSQRLWCLGGSRVTEVEQRLGTMYGVAHVVACSSGTAAIHAALAACGVQSGDEVITTPLSDWGSVIGILALGAVPVFCDLDESTFSLDPAFVSAAITSRTRAIVLVHLAGYPARVRDIAAMASTKGIALIEDCAQSPYAFLDGQPLGTFGVAGAFSTNDSKHVSCGEGGFLVTHDALLAKTARRFVDKGYDREKSDIDVAFLGYNYRMSELQAAVLNAQLSSLPDQVKQRQRYHDWLMAGLEGVAGYVPVRVLPGGQGSFWTILGRLDLDQFATDRKTIADALQAEGIPVKTALAPGRILYALSIFRSDRRYPAGLCSMAERIADAAFVLPCSPFFTETDAEETAHGVRKVLRHFHR